MTTDNEWVEGAVPGGVEIAQVVLEHIHEKGWVETWSDCDGFRVCPRVRVWLDGYMDHDFEQVYLLRVWTESEPDGDGWTATVTDHLAIHQRHVGTAHLDVEWRQEPRLFFDADHEWGYDGLRWWIDWTQALGEARADAHLRERPDLIKSTIAYNSGVIVGEREKARKMGLASALPYLKEC